MSAVRCSGLLVIVSLATAACAKPETNAAPDGGSHAPVSSATSPAGGGPRRAHLSAKVVAEAALKTAPVLRETLLGTVDLPGELAADPDKIALIASPVAGRIEEVLFKEGALVTKGDRIAVVRVPELGKIRSAYAATTVKAQAARANADRVAHLRGEGLSGDQEAVDAEAQAEALAADAHALAEQLGAIGSASGASGASLTLRAPLSGVALARDAVAGQPVTPDQTLGSVADLSDMWFLAHAYERDLPALHVGAPAIVSFDALGKEHLPGTVSFVSSQPDRASRTYTARIQLANPGHTLRLGLYGVAHVLSAADGGSSPPALVISHTALVDLEGKTVVFVDVGGGDYEVREVALGDSALGRVEVRTGVVEGEQVVVDGGFNLKSAVLKSTLGEGE